jgi:hypothetical protein
MEFPEFIREMDGERRTGQAVEYDRVTGQFLVQWDDDTQDWTSLETEGVHWFRLPTHAQVVAALEVVRRWLGPVDGPEIKWRDIGHEGPYWCVSGEIGRDWPYPISIDQSVTWPDGIWVEPVNHFALAIHRKS